VATLDTRKKKVATLDHSIDQLLWSQGVPRLPGLITITGNSSSQQQQWFHCGSAQPTASLNPVSP